MKGGAVGHNFERDPPKDHIPAKFSVIWFSGFRGEDLNVIFYQNMHNRYKSAEQKIPQKNSDCKLNYSLPWAADKIWAHFGLY